MATSMEWRPISGSALFEVSEYGDVRHVRSHRRLRGFIDADGYLRYILRLNGKRSVVPAHRLVALTFLGAPPSAKHEVAHGNGSRLFNHHSNLRWALPIENHADKAVHGTVAAGERNGHAKITEQDVERIRIEYRRIKQPGSGRSVAELDERYGLHRSTIVSIATGKSWSHLPMPNFGEMIL